MDAADRGGVLRPNQAGTRPAYAPAIRAAADLGEAPPDLAPWDVAVLPAIAYRQPIGRDDLSRAFGREVSRELIGRLRARDLIAPGLRSPVPAPYTFVTTQAFLAAFDLQILRDLPDAEMMGEAGLERTGKGALHYKIEGLLNLSKQLSCPTAACLHFALWRIIK